MKKVERYFYPAVFFDFTENDTDYPYLINRSDAEVQMELAEGKVVVLVNALAVVHYENLREMMLGDEENEARVPERVNW